MFLAPLLSPAYMSATSSPLMIGYEPLEGLNGRVCVFVTPDTRGR